MAGTVICNMGITTALTNAVQTAVGGLGQRQALTIQAAFTYVASAATTVDAYVQTTLNGGITWFDVANFHFTTASATKYQNVNGDTAVNASATLTAQTLTNDTSINGFLGDQLRVVITSVGTYGPGTQLRIDIFGRG